MKFNILSQANYGYNDTYLKMALVWDPFYFTLVFYVAPLELDRGEGYSVYKYFVPPGLNVLSFLKMFFFVKLR
jgi:hypothetical protein